MNNLASRLLRRAVRVLYPVINPLTWMRILGIRRSHSLSVGWAWQSWQASQREAWAEAIYKGRLAVVADPDNVESYRVLGYAYHHAGQLPEAREAYRNGLQVAPTDPRLHQQLADLELAAHNYAAAQAAYGRAAALSPNTPELAVAFAHTLAAHDRYQEAAELLEPIFSDYPDNPAVMGALGSMYAWTGKEERALALLTAAMERGRSSALTYYSVAAALYKLGQAERALPYAREARQLAPEDGACQQFVQMLERKIS